MSFIKLLSLSTIILMTGCSSMVVTYDASVRWLDHVKLHVVCFQLLVLIVMDQAMQLAWTTIRWMPRQVYCQYHQVKIRFI